MTGTWNPCLILRKHNIQQGNSGIRITNNPSEDDLIINDKETIQICLNCPADECAFVKLDKKKAGKK